MLEPLVSVVMPVYNPGKYLVDAVASILDQSMSDFELVCVDDGCKDGSSGILDWFAAHDSRVKVIHQDNQGIVAALNRGVSVAKAPLIARMDADDLAAPNRLQLQVDFLSQHPTCVALGGAIVEIDADGDRLGRSELPVSHAAIEHNLLHRRTGMFHPTVMMRAEAFHAVGGYQAKYQWIEDHDLWLRLAQRGQLANLQQVVLAYRQHASSVCWQRSQQQRELMNDLLRHAYQVRDLPFPEGLIVTNQVQRTVANPGKWARAAAKGGYPATMFKHLRRMLRSHEVHDLYCLRMLFECCLRVSAGWLSRQLRKSSDEAITIQSDWRDRWQKYGLPPGSTRYIDAA